MSRNISICNESMDNLHDINAWANVTKYHDLQREHAWMDNLHDTKSRVVRCCPRSSDFAQFIETLPNFVRHLPFWNTFSYDMSARLFWSDTLAWHCVPQWHYFKNSHVRHELTCTLRTLKHLVKFVFKHILRCDAALRTGYLTALHVSTRDPNVI